MKIREKMTSVVFVLLLPGCMALPETPSALVSTATTVETYCYAENRKIIEKRIKKFLYQCYQTNLISKEEKMTNGTRISLGNISGIGFSAEILDESPKCKTSVIMYGITFFWKITFDIIDRAANGEEIKCPYPI